MVPIQGLFELVLEVRDLQQAEHFYGTVLGFPVKRMEPRVALVEAPQCHIQLRLFGTPGHRGATAFHFAFAVALEDIEPITQILKEHGVWARGPVDFGEMVSVFCFDPDSNEVEFSAHSTRQAQDL